MKEILYNMYIIVRFLLILIVNLGYVLFEVVFNFVDIKVFYFVVDGIGGYVFVNIYV